MNAMGNIGKSNYRDAFEFVDLHASHRLGDIEPASNA